jgi:hypothetical protein
VGLHQHRAFVSDLALDPCREAVNDDLVRPLNART